MNPTDPSPGSPSSGNIISSMVAAIDHPGRPRVFRDICLINEAFSHQECSELVRCVETMGMKPLTSSLPLRKTRKIGIDSPELAEAIWKRIEPYMPFKEVRDDLGDIWRVTGLSDQIKFLAFGQGDSNRAHCDQPQHVSYRCRSFATLIIYLNTVQSEIGGATHFVDHGLKVQPREGCALVYLTDNLFIEDESIAGDGKTFKSEKYALRTNIMYECKKFRNAEIRRRIYDLKTQAQNCHDDQRSVELWETVHQLSLSLREQTTPAAAAAPASASAAANPIVNAVSASSTLSASPVATPSANVAIDIVCIDLAAPVITPATVSVASDKPRE